MSKTDDELADIYELVLDQGLDIIIFCKYGLREIPVEAYLVQYEHNGHRNSVVRIPIPWTIRDDVKMPRYAPLEFGVHQQ